MKKRTDQADFFHLIPCVPHGLMRTIFLDVPSLP
jgi:hypothetical protein